MQWKCVAIVVPTMSSSEEDDEEMVEDDDNDEQTTDEVHILSWEATKHETGTLSSRRRSTGAPSATPGLVSIAK